MKITFKIIAFAMAILSLATPNVSLAASSINGPFTFTSITASINPIVSGETKITIKGSGLNNATGNIAFSVVHSSSGTYAELPDYTKTSTSISFVVPASLETGKYSLSVAGSPTDARKLVVLDNGADWVFDVEKPGPTITEMTPSSGPTGTLVTFTGKGFLSTNTVTYNSSFDASGTISYVPSTNGTTAQFTIPPTLQVGTHKFALSNAQGGTSYKMFTVTSSQIGEKHPEGTNVIGSDGTVYMIMGGGRNAYTSAGAFTSFKFNTWAAIAPINSFDLSLPIGTFIAPRNGSLILDNKTVYLISLGQRMGFANEAAFKGLNYSYSNVYPGDTSFMTNLPPINSSDQAHPQGTLVNDNGTLYVMQNGTKVGMPSIEVLDSWGYWPTDAVPANKYDKAAPVSGVRSKRLSYELAA